MTVTEEDCMTVTEEDCMTVTAGGLHDCDCRRTV